MYVDLYLRFLGNLPTQIFGIIVKLGVQDVISCGCVSSYVKVQYVRSVHCTPNDDDDDDVNTAPVQSLVGTSVGSPWSILAHALTHPTTPRARSGTTLLLYDSHGSSRPEAINHLLRAQRGCVIQREGEGRTNQWLKGNRQFH